jgi:type IV pilus assembly protein PilW
VVGCENGFVNNAALDYTTLACNGGAANSQPDAISIIYEGDTSNTVPTAAGLPTDCLGASVAPTVGSSSPLGAANGITYSRIENRYYVANNTLFCMGVGNLGQGQPVIDNVVDMQITYGVANTPAPGARMGANDPMYEPVMFMRADQVNTLPAFPTSAVGPDARWNRVVSATICLLMRSDLGALDQVTPYTDCQGAAITPAAGDTRAYRLVRIHVGFKNRTPPCPDSNPAAATRIDHCDITL